MLLLGIDVGTSSIKVSVVDGASGAVHAAVQYPDTERAIIAPQTGWAEQSPETWWDDVCMAINLLGASSGVSLQHIGAIGISYQMHGLVLLDKEGAVLRNSIIWCDSRAVPYGNAAATALGERYYLENLLNAPGNFTAAKLAWVKDAEPDIYSRIDKIMLPGDYIAYKLTGNLTTTPSALSEGIFWDFKTNSISQKVMDHFGFSRSFIPPVQAVFSVHGQLSAGVAAKLHLRAGIPVSYKAGDQLNNALSLNVLQPGEVAATAGTSGVIYGISNGLTYDRASRVNSFAHVNHTADAARVGVLLCINGTGIMNRWNRDICGKRHSYAEMNTLAASVPAGSEGLTIFPFGNGAERMLENKMTGAQLRGIDLNKHTPAHLYRGVQEGIAFAFRYGLDIMKEAGMDPSVIRAGYANMFLSEVFTAAFVNVTGVPVALHRNDGSAGAALGAGIGCGYYASPAEAFGNHEKITVIEPGGSLQLYEDLYQSWKQDLLRLLEAS